MPLQPLILKRTRERKTDQQQFITEIEKDRNKQSETLLGGLKSRHEKIREYTRRLIFFALPTLTGHVTPWQFTSSIRL